MNKTTKIIKENLKSLMRELGIPTPYALAKICKVDQKTANNLISDNGNPNANPTIKVIESYANPLKIEPWMLLMKNFPFKEVIKNKRILKEITPEGYLLLSAFESAPENVRYSIMDAVALAISHTDITSTNMIKESQAAYIKNNMPHLR